MYCAYASFVCLSVWILIDKPTISIIGYTAKNIHPNIIAAHANAPVKIKITHPKYGSIVTSYAILKIVFVTAKKIPNVPCFIMYIVLQIPGKAMSINRRI